MKVGGKIPWYSIPVCETSQIYYLMGRRPMTDVFGQPFKGPIIPFGSLVEYHPFYCKGPVKSPSIWKESLTWIVPRIRFVRGWNLEGWRTGCRPWGVGDDGRIGNLLKKTQCERDDISQRKGIIYLPIEDGRIKLLGGDQDLNTST